MGKFGSIVRKSSGGGIASNVLNTNYKANKDIIAASAQADAAHYGKTVDQVNKEYSDMIYGTSRRRKIGGYMGIGKSIVGG